MASIAETVRERMTAAWKAGEVERRDALRLILSSFKNAEIDLGHPLEDADAVRVLQKEAKQRRDSIAEYEKASRADLVAQERAELDVIEQFLPAQMGDDELRAIVQQVIAETGAASPSDLGKVMRPLMEKVQGRADGGRVNKMARDILGA